MSAEPRYEVKQTTTVLVVDDDRAVRDSLKFSLELEGFCVRTYADGQALLTDCDLPKDACLIIDQVLPGMSGLETVDAIRRLGNLNPAILMASHPHQPIRKGAEKRGMLVVEKPFFGRSLIDAIRRVIAEQHL